MNRSNRTGSANGSSGPTKSITAKVEAFCLEHGLIAPGRCLLLACSGGPDSMALVSIFLHLRQAYRLTLHIAHAEHGIRGSASLGDAAYVRDFCRQHGLPFHPEHLAVPAFAAENKLSEETAARLLRYRFLRRTAKEIGADRIVTAHHLNDQAETVLQHLLRGAGPQGLCGMSPDSRGIIRPLLCLYRAEIEDYCCRHQIAARQDETNFSPDYERNRIRLDLMPRLEEYNVKAAAAICRSARLIAREHSFIAQCAAQKMSELADEDGSSLCLRAAGLKDCHAAVRSEIYRLALASISAALENITFEHIDKIDHLLYNGRIGAVLQLPGGIRVSRGYESLQICLAAAKEASPPKAYSLPAKINGAARLPGGLVLSLEPAESIFPIRGRNSCFIDADKVEGDLFIRSRKNGDRMIPKGMSGSKKIKDILIDSKIPAEQRDSVPLLCDGRGIIWLAGIRQAQRCAADGNSRRIWYAKLEKL